MYIAYYSVCGVNLIIGSRTGLRFVVGAEHLPPHLLGLFAAHRYVRKLARQMLDEVE